MASPMTSICERYAAKSTKTSPKILHVQNSEKQENAPGKARNGQNRVRFGCWRGWERMKAGTNRSENLKSEPKRTPSPCKTCKTKTGGNSGFPPVLWQGQKDLSRLPARSVRGRAPLARTRPSTRSACLGNNPLPLRKRPVLQMQYWLLAGAVRFELTARGFGVDVGGSPEERGRGCVGRFSPQVRKGAVLIWCFRAGVSEKSLWK